MIPVRSLVVVCAAVAALTVAADAQAQVKLSSAAPTAGQPGIQVVTLTGTGFPAGTIQAASVTVRLEPATPNAGPTATTPASAIALVIGTTRRLTFTVPAAALVSAPVGYRVSVAGATTTGTAFTSDSVGFTINPGAVLTDVSPAFASPSDTVTVGLTGNFTNFVQGSTQAQFGSGIAVGSGADGGFGTVTVTSQTTATASVRIASAAASGVRDVVVRTGLQQVSLTGAFTIARPPTITASVAPAPNTAGWNNSNVTVTFTCLDTPLCPSPVVVSTEGPQQQISRTVTGAAGKTATAAVSISIDKTAPALAITAPDDNIVVTAGTVQIRGSVADAVSGLASVRCNGASTSFGGGSLSCAVTLAQGANAINVTTTDVAGNSTTVTRNVRFDTNTTQGPAVHIVSPTASALFNVATIAVSGTVDDPSATVTVNGVAASVNGTSFIAQQVPVKEGITLVTATAISPGGGVGTDSTSIIVDTTPPIITIQAPKDGAIVTSPQVAVSGMINDIVSGTVNAEQASVTVNGTNAEISNRSFLIPGVLLVRGRNVITAVARDRAGNERQTQITVTLQDQAGQQKLVAVSGDGQTAQIGQTLSDPLVVQLVDAAGRVVPDREVTFTVRRSDGVLHAFPVDGQELSAKTDQNGEARVTFTLGTRAGAGINEVAARAVGFVGEVVFSASSTIGTAVHIKGAGVMGESFRGLAGEALPHPLEAIVMDASGNPVSRIPVTFSVEQGGGSVGGQASIVKETDSDGRVAAMLVLGQQEGVNNNVVSATFAGNTDLPLTFTVSGVLAGPATNTRISGVVLDNADKPIPGATAKMVGTDLQAVTNEQGRFTIDHAPVGTLTLIVDGRTSSRPETFPFLAFMINSVAGQDNTIGMPMYLPPLDAANSKEIGGDEEVVLTMKEVPGLAFTIFPHSATFPDGSHVGRMSVSQVHADKVPMPPPYGTAPRIVWTLQPAGVKFDPPIRIQLPNVDGLAPGRVIEVFQFDHDIEQFVSVGAARVSPDGSVIVSDPGFGTTKSGWGGAPPPPPPPPTCYGPPCPTGPSQDLDPLDCRIPNGGDVCGANGCTSIDSPDGAGCGSGECNPFDSNQNPATCQKKICKFCGSGSCEIGVHPQPSQSACGAATSSDYDCHITNVFTRFAGIPPHFTATNQGVHCGTLGPCNVVGCRVIDSPTTETCSPVSPSLHYCDWARDIRSKNLCSELKSAIAGAIVSDMGGGKAFVEAAGSGNEHFHVEFPGLTSQECIAQRASQREGPSCGGDNEPDCHTCSWRAMPPALDPGDFAPKMTFAGVHYVLICQ